MSYIINTINYALDGAPKTGCTGKTWATLLIQLTMHKNAWDGHEGQNIVKGFLFFGSTNWVFDFDDAIVRQLSWMNSGNGTSNMKNLKDVVLTFENLTFLI